MVDSNSQLDLETSAALERHGFDRSLLEALRGKLKGGRADDRDNRLNALVAPPQPGDIGVFPPLASKARERLYAHGVELIRAGRVAAVVLAGGRATPFNGLATSTLTLAEGLSAIDIKLADCLELSRSIDANIPVWVMTSFATHEAVERAIAPWNARGLTARTFSQLASLRLTEKGELFRDALGRLSPYALGHGDLPFALQRSGVRDELSADGIKHLFVSSVDNLAGTLDPAMIGAHEQSGAELSFELAPLWIGERGAVPARVNGRLHIVEPIRYPASFDERSIPLCSTRSIVCELSALEREYDLPWLRMTQRIEGRVAIQFVRYATQLAEFTRARGILVEREGIDGRYLRIDDPEALEQRREDMELVLRARGLLPPLEIGPPVHSESLRPPEPYRAEGS